MSANGPWKSRSAKGTIIHHSARGNVQRNAGNFTRGSQLFTHEMLMWMSGARIPLYIFLGVLFLSFSITTTLRLQENEIGLILMKCYSDGWKFLELSPTKMANLTLQNGRILHLPMIYVADVPNVQLAWAKLMRCLTASVVASAFITVPINIWFVNYSRRKGRDILEERHERGAMLVDGPELRQQILQYNLAKFAEEAIRAFPKLTAAQAAKLPYSKRKKKGVHSPYTIGSIPFPWRTEQSHVMLVGTTGAGKTTALKNLVLQARERGHKAIIFDLTGTFTESFYNPQKDFILNPADERCPSWSLFNDCRTRTEFMAAAEALIPNPHNGDPFWSTAARTLLVEMCLKLQSLGLVKNSDIVNQLMKTSLKVLHEYLKATLASSLTSPDVVRMAESIRGVLIANAQALDTLPEDGIYFSITQWVHSTENPGSILFINSTHDQLTLYRSLLTLWLNIAVNALMRMPRTRELNTWFLFDEIHALHRLPAIENGMQTARGFGGAFVLGIHSFAAFAETYGELGAKNLTSLARTKLILTTPDRDTAEQCSAYIGHREVRQMDESYSYGNNNTRDAATITPRREVQPLVLPDDITNLQSLDGFIKFPDGFDAARITLRYVDYPKVAEGFVQRPGLIPIVPTLRTGLNDAPAETQGPEDVGGREDDRVDNQTITETQRAQLEELRNSYSFFEDHGTAYWRDVAAGSQEQKSGEQTEQQTEPSRPEDHRALGAKKGDGEDDKHSHQNAAAMMKPTTIAEEIAKRELATDYSDDLPARQGGGILSDIIPMQSIPLSADVPDNAIDDDYGMGD